MADFDRVGVLVFASWCLRLGVSRCVCRLHMDTMDVLDPGGVSDPGGVADLRTSSPQPLDLDMRDVSVSPPLSPSTMGACGLVGSGGGGGSGLGVSAHELAM